MHMVKLYKFDNEQFVVDINYQLMGETATNNWGELVPVECVRMDGFEDYMLELDDNRKLNGILKRELIGQ